MGEKRPKAIDSSHNACRYGYPFFLSPSDDDAMLEIPNPTPSVHQTVRSFVSFFVPPPKRKETRLSKTSQQNKNSKTSEKPTLHIFSQIPKNPRISKSLPKMSKAQQNPPKSMKNSKNSIKH